MSTHTESPSATAKAAQPMPFFRVANLSTAHLTVEDLKLIDDASTHGVVMSNEHGAIVSLPESEECYAERKAAGYSDTFLTALREVAKAGIDYVWFDADGDYADTLPTFSHG